VVVTGCRALTVLPLVPCYLLGCLPNLCVLIVSQHSFTTATGTTLCYATGTTLCYATGSIPSSPPCQYQECCFKSAAPLAWPSPFDMQLLSCRSAPRCLAASNWWALGVGTVCLAAVGLLSNLRTAAFCDSTPIHSHFIYICASLINAQRWIERSMYVYMRMYTYVHIHIYMYSIWMNIGR